MRTRQRDKLQATLREQGIVTDIHYPLPAHQQPIYTELAPSGSLPITEQLAQDVLSLPMYPELTQAEVEAVATAVRTALRVEF